VTRAHPIGELRLAEPELPAAADHDSRERLVRRQAFEPGTVLGVACAGAHRCCVRSPGRGDVLGAWRHGRGLIRIGKDRSGRIRARGSWRAPRLCIHPGLETPHRLLAIWMAEVAVGALEGLLYDPRPFHVLFIEGWLRVWGPLSRSGKRKELLSKREELKLLRRENAQRRRREPREQPAHRAAWDRSLRPRGQDHTCRRRPSRRLTLQQYHRSDSYRIGRWSSGFED
jgi:hypothetical protein